MVGETKYFSMRSLRKSERIDDITTKKSNRFHASWKQYHIHLVWFIWDMI